MISSKMQAALSGLYFFGIPLDISCLRYNFHNCKNTIGKK